MVTQFGSGSLWAVPTFKQGAAVTNPTPQKFGVLQDVQLDISEDVKELHGQLKYPVDVAAGKAKVTGKAKFADIRGSMLAELFTGDTVSTGGKKEVEEGPTAIPATPFQITVTNGATFFRDLGVRNAATGLFMTRVASAPAAGQYSVSVAGVYTFASADNVSAISVIIGYVYTVAGTGKSLVISNRTMGDKPEFEVFFIQERKALQNGMRFNRCISTKLSLASKLDDFTIPEFDFSAFADAAGNIGEIWSPE